MEPILIVTDLLLLLFWMRLWSLPERELYFNPFLSAPTRLTDRVLDFLRPVLPLPGRLAALLVLTFLLAFRAVVLNHFAAQWSWSIRLGAFMVFTPQAPGLHGALIFSLLDFLFFVARFWGVYLLVQLLTPVLRRDRASEAFHVAALPLSALRGWLQVLLLVAAHAILVYELVAVGIVRMELPREMAPLTAGASLAPTHRLLYHGWLTALSIADSLQAAEGCIVAFFLGGFAAFFLQNPLLNAICNEGINVLLGRFARRLLVSLFDLTPLVYFFVVDRLYALLCAAVMFLMAKI